MLNKIITLLFFTLLSSSALSSDSIVHVDYESYDSIKKHASTIFRTNDPPFHLEAFTRIKEGKTQFQYYSYPLKISVFFKSYLILEDYESEWAVWFVTYSLDGKLINAKEIMYNNAEGCWTTNSTININERAIQKRKYDCGMSDEENARSFLDYIITEKGRIDLKQP